MKTILFLAANPKDTNRLRLDEEIRDIQGRLKTASNRANIDFRQHGATRPDDLRQALLQAKPQIVHFSGHGETEGILLENDAGMAHLVSPDALAELFGLAAKAAPIQCVVLNACYSEAQAEAIAAHIPFVIGMNDAIGDRSALKFSIGFYDAIGEGRTIEDAYQFGCNALRMENLPGDLTPVLRRKVDLHRASRQLTQAAAENGSLTWSEDEWRHLLYAIHQDSCILLLGPDASGIQENGAFQPLSDLFARGLAEQIPAQVAEWRLDPANLTQMTQHFALEKGRDALEMRAVEFYEQFDEPQNEIYRHLAALPFSLSIMTTPDPFWPDALRQEQKEPGVARYHLRGKHPDSNPSLMPDGTPQHPVAFYLYGHLDEPKSLILTENDLLDLLVAVIKKNPALPNNLLSELRDPRKSLLFLGFGFKQWYLRMLLHILLQGQSKENYSIALEQAAPRAPEELRSTILFYRRSDYKLHLYQYDLLDFSAELRQRYETEAANKFNKTRLNSTPCVFLCHALEDADMAKNIAAQLESGGFRVWRDASQQRGGTTWPPPFEQAIQTSDYVVVLHTKAFCGCQAEDLTQEIECALAQQMQCRPGVQFVIPVQFGDCPIREELEHLKSVALSSAQDAAPLLQILRRDQEHRKRK